MERVNEDGGVRVKLTDDDLTVGGCLGDLVDGSYLRVGHSSNDEDDDGWPRLLGCLGLEAGREDGGLVIQYVAYSCTLHNPRLR